MPDSQTQNTKAHFDRLSGDWSQNYASDNAPMQARVAQFVSAVQVQVTQGGRLLDFGCGSGEITAAMARAGYQVTGADISARMIEVAKRKHGDIVSSWVALEAGAPLPFGDASFDGVTASSVLEYHTDPAALMREVFRTLRAGGKFLFTVPDMRHPARQAEQSRLWRSRGLAGMIAQLTPWAHYYEYLRVSVNRFSVVEWEAMVRAAGFELEPVAACSAPLVMFVAGKR